MSFVNSYNSYIEYSEEFEELNQEIFLYSLSYTSAGKVLIIKAEPNSNILWEKEYKIEGLEKDFRFKKIVQIRSESEIEYVIYAKDRLNHSLVKIDSSGNILMVKSLLINSTSEKCYLVGPNSHDTEIISNIDPVFYFVYAGYDAEGDNLLDYSQVISIKFNALLVTINSIAYTPDKVKNVLIANVITNQLGVSVLFDQIEGTNHILELSLELKFINDIKYSIANENISRFISHDFIRYNNIDDSLYIVTGSSIDKKNVLLLVVEKSTSLMYVYSAPRSEGCLSSLAFSGSSKAVYMTIYNEYSKFNYISKLKFSSSFYDPQIQWSKELLDYAGIKRSIVKRATMTSVSQVIDQDFNFLYYTNLDFDSCLPTSIKYQLESENKQEIKIDFKDTNAVNVHLENKTFYFELIESEKINLCPDNVYLNQDIQSSIQSSNLYLQAAGSKGSDSNKGIHLRWMLKGVLEEHLPKGDYEGNTANFNNTDDYVRIYRTPYVPYKTKLDFSALTPIVDDSSHQWLYIIDEVNISVIFRNTSKYNQLRLQQPNITPIAFLEAYGNELIEIETKSELSFAVTTYFTEIGESATNIRLELLSVESNSLTAPKFVSLRKKDINLSALGGNQLISENIRSTRFVAQNCFINKIEFEFYSLFLAVTYGAETPAWFPLGKHALSKDTNEVYKRLEPTPGLVHGQWLRYNDGAYVNVNNYKNRWTGSGTADVNSIHDVIDKYISLSSDPTNPQGNEKIYFNDQSNSVGNPNAYTNKSNLTILQLGSLDFHIARMLGLGMLDYKQNVFEGKFIYVAEYYTYDKDLQDGFGPRNVQHLYCSLPTSINDERMPLPIDLKPIVDMPFTFENDTENSSAITDIDGYSLDGKIHFVQLFHEELPEEGSNAAFFSKDVDFNSADFTIPIFSGIEYRKTPDEEDSSATWRKPELSHNQKYSNVDNTLTIEENRETVAILLPSGNKPLYVRRERSYGYHDYCGYGINLFSRSTKSTVVRKIKTKLRTKNLLQPPSNINAFFIQKENPLVFSTATEQSQLDLIDSPIINNKIDKTFVRLLFDYNHGQELIEYQHLLNDIEIPNFELLEKNHELFADYIEVFYRNHIPLSVTGAIVSIAQHPTDTTLLIAQSAIYEVTSSGEQYLPSIPNGQTENFIGSLILIGDQSFLVKDIITTSSSFPKFVFEKDEGTSLLSFTLSVTNPSLFMIVENLQKPSSWNTSEQGIFNVAIDHRAVHEEEVYTKNPSNSNQTNLQRFRGIYRNGEIEKIYEEAEPLVENRQTNSADNPVATEHRGLYKITLKNNANIADNRLGHHSQYNNPEFLPHNVDFSNGIVRLHTISQYPNKIEPRKVYRIIRAENIGDPVKPLVLYFEDPTFPKIAADLATYKGKFMADNLSKVQQKINYYPSYKVYFKYDLNSGLTENFILPSEDDDEEQRISLFGLRSADNPNEIIISGEVFDNASTQYSLISPQMMYAKSIVEPLQPLPPSGGLYATRPDFYGKSTYTFTNEFLHKPYSVQYSRASDIQILSAIYDDKTINSNGLTTLEHVMKNILKNGNEPYYIDFWNDFLNFREFIQTTPPDPLLTVLKNDYNLYPSDGTAKLPLPDSKKLIDSINAFIEQHNLFYNLTGANATPAITSITGLQQTVIAAFPNRNIELKIFNFVVDVIHNCFVPLTEIPIIYKHIKEKSAWTPIPKKQVIRDRNGNLLKPTDAEFAMAPMAVRYKIIDKYFTQFTDFGLDGASTARYFYTTKEINLEMKTSPYSTIAGPISLVNAAPPTAPEIIKVIPVLENRALGIKPAMQLQINSYPSIENIKKIQIYRTTIGVDSLSIRTMKLLEPIDIELAGLITESKWIFEDDFNDLVEIPYGDPLYYRVVVLREIKYNNISGELVNDLAPSEASKVVLTNMVENYNPESPVLQYHSEPLLVNQNVLHHITLDWKETTYKGNYHLYKINAKGNWIEIARVISDRLEMGKYHVYNTSNIANNNPTNAWQDSGIILHSSNDIIYLQLEETNVNDSNLTVLSNDGTKLFHHFKVIAENTSGMLSSKENILTIYNEVSWTDIGGIAPNDRSSGMIIGQTFIVREN